MPAAHIDCPRLPEGWRRSAGRRAPLASAMLATMLAGCAAPQILVSDTRSFVASGRNAGAEAASFFERAEQRQMAANVLLVASDPSCEWGSAIYLRQDFTTGSSLCVSGTATKGAIRYPLRPATAVMSPATAQAVAALAAYVGELATLTKAHEPRFAQAVQDAEGRLKTLQGALNEAAKLDAGTIGTIAPKLQAATTRYKAPVDAIAGMVDYLDGLATAARQADGVTQFVARRGPEMEDGIEALAVTIDAVTIGIVMTSGQAAQDALIEGTRRQLRGVVDFEKRRQTLTQLVAALAEQRRIDAGLATAATVLRDLKTQHAALRAFAARTYTPADLARIRQQQADMTWDLIGRLGSLAGAIGGAI